MSEAASRRGTETRQRSRHVDVRCTDAELAAITAAAARAGMTVGAFMRHQAIGTAGPRAVRRPQVDRAELARVLAALGRLGSNVNQLARAANTGEIPARDELADAAVATREMRDALMRALGRGD
jgi:uncharacterized protein (DUF1778 family)